MENFVPKRVLFFWMLLDLSVHSVMAALSVKPKNTVSGIGKEAYFDCATTVKEREIHWSHYPLGAFDPDIVYAYSSFRTRYIGRFKMERNNLTGAFNLLIMDVNKDDAGIYECQDDVGLGDKSRAELIVLNSEPACSSNMTQGEVIIGINNCGFSTDVVQFFCNINYTGNLSPKLEWIRSGQNTPIKDGVTFNNMSGSVKANLRLEDVSSVGGESFTCRIASPSASIKYSCSSGVVNVWKSTNDFSLFEKRVNETVNCQKGNSQQSLCSYKWTKTDSKGEAVVSTGPTTRLESPGLYRCQMDCTIKNKPCSINGMMVHVAATTSQDGSEAAQTGEKDSYKPPFIAILIILILLIIGLVGFVIWRRKQRKHGKEKIALMKNQKEAEIQRLETRLRADQTAYAVERAEKERVLAQSQAQWAEERAILLKRLEDLTKKLVGIEYLEKPVFKNDIQTNASKDEDKSIKGIALLNNEIYIVSQRESEVDVYDSTSLELRRKWKLAELACPEDASACILNRCLYISENKPQAKEILRVDPNGKLIIKWPIGNEFCRLSVSPDATVVAVVHDNSKLMEYSADGNLIRTCDLSVLKMGHPMHAVKLKTGNFLVIHGFLKDKKHRLCEIDVGSNRCVKSFGREKGGGNSQLSNPTCLAVDHDGSIMVADTTNGRVVLLGANFEFKREILTKGDQISTPTRILLDEPNGRLYVGDYKSKRRILYAFDIIQNT